MKLDIFKIKSICLQDQYKNFVQQNYNITVNGSEASFQNNADFLSFFLSSKAFKNWMAVTSIETLRLPGLFFDSKQFYWISVAQRFCSIDRSVDVIRRKILSDYPLDSFRIFNSLRNNGDFAESFNCPINSPMNLNLKC
jgi:Peptidase family M13